MPVSCGCGAQAGKAVHACGEVLDTGDGGRFLQLGRDMKEQRKYTSCCALQGKAIDALFRVILRHILLRICPEFHQIVSLQNSAGLLDISG